jgi:Spy/CpxP family protein refolding chaperone
MKTTAKMVWMAAIVFLVSLGIQGMGTAEAVEGHHGQETQSPAPGGADEKGPGTMRGSGGGPGAMGMMSGPGSDDSAGMMGSDMMGHGMVGPGMMRMMMSHMMGGPGGMGKMMGPMGCTKGHGGPGGMARMENMLERLALTPEQWDKVRTLARERLEKMADLWARRMKLQIELASLRRDEKVDAEQVKNLFVRTAEAQAEMFLASLDYLHELRAVLSPEQREQLEGMGL